MQAWENFISAEEKNFGKETIDKWLRSLKIIHFDACNLYLEAHDSFQILWFEEHIRFRIKKTLLNNNHHPIKVHLTLIETTPPALVKSSIKNKKKDQFVSKDDLSFTSETLDQNATFESFFVPSKQQIPFKILYNTFHSLVEVEQNSFQEALNPIYLYGTKGTGKTHLLMAAAHEVQKRGKKAFYVRAETFTEHVVSAIRSGNMQKFRKAYRHVDVLLIDDVHLFARKAATQEELFHTFNALHTAKCQIFLTADCPPQHLEAIEPRLISRFEWGIVLCLEKLEHEELHQIVRKRCELFNFPLSNEVTSFIVKAFNSNPKALMRSIEALILRLHTQKTSQASSMLTSIEAEKYLKDLIQEEENSALSPEKIIQAVSDFYGILPADILGKSQSHDCVLPRQVAMYLCRKELNIPFLKIGSFFLRDHSTVMASVKLIESKIASSDKEIIAAIADILRKLAKYCMRS